MKTPQTPVPADTNLSEPIQLYQQMMRIRYFEEKVLAEFSRGHFQGTTHTYLGQEANAVGVLSQRGADDIVVSNHRSHGHFLAYGGDPHLLFAELMGKSTGVCGGRGGSQHLQWKNFYSNGILGGTVPLATGIALAEKQRESGAIVIVFMGDGALGEGVVYESLNLAGLWQLPILFVLENNRLAQTTPIEAHLAGSITTRFSAFGIPVQEVETSDVLEIQKMAGDLIQKVHNECSPQALVLHTWRFGPHSKGDDLRPAEMLMRMRQNCDPIIISANYLETAACTQTAQRAEEEIAKAYAQALNDPPA